MMFASWPSQTTRPERRRCPRPRSCPALPEAAGVRPRPIRAWGCPCILHDAGAHDRAVCTTDRGETPLSAGKRGWHQCWRPLQVKARIFSISCRDHDPPTAQRSVLLVPDCPAAIWSRPRRRGRVGSVPPAGLDARLGPPRTGGRDADSMDRRPGPWPRPGGDLDGRTGALAGLVVLAGRGERRPRGPN